MTEREADAQRRRGGDAESDDALLLSSRGSPAAAMPTTIGIVAGEREVDDDDGDQGDRAPRQSRNRRGSSCSGVKRMQRGGR